MHGEPRMVRCGNGAIAPVLAGWGQALIARSAEAPKHSTV